MCNKEVVSRTEPLDRAVTNFYFRYARFPLSSARRLVEFDTSVICYVMMHYLSSFLLQDMLLSLHKFAFEGKHEIYHEHVVYLLSILCAGPGCD